jgi:hypothetical protein
LRDRYLKLVVHPPIGKEKKYPSSLLANLNVNSFEMAIKQLEWFTMRWKIEMFHNNLKLDRKAEVSKLRTS